ncbi:hypothetical protein G647_02502 [Cladophialophora carrionii CBS 160.54]|uniref:Vanadium chloroperoxidase N-terminal domain-containing protein n=1 Tax=Cladophialophora carrionii CBS 160.54 TaxID=1279043 RepID=V9DHC2_9EURO|nr:uncharacterized protein G647_02502 [Cladophialophora carrionii CBS 160.54]ETI25728.1 hypothetical protein G647_02502 [Cladophialophora carrionii CBS 160.54]
MSLPVLPPVVEAGGARNFKGNYVFYWNEVALDLVRLTHTVSGPQSGPPLTARFLGILHLAMHDAYFAVYPYTSHPNHNPHFTQIGPYLSDALLRPEPQNLNRGKAEAANAVAGAAITVLNKLFKNPANKDPQVSVKATLALGNFIDSAFRAYQEAHNLNLRSPGYLYGVRIANAVLKELEIKAAEPGVGIGTYMPNANQPYFFDDDPSHPIRQRPIDPNDPEDGNRPTRPYHGPFYGTTAAVLATTQDWKTADPPVVPTEALLNPPSAPDPDYLAYLESVQDVFRMGGIEGLASTKRRPSQTVAGLFWAYDGVNLIGTPPRLYNQIIRQVAFDNKVGSDADLHSDENNAQFLRLFALANTAMADAGIFCWRDKYKYELWRPLSGVRADPTGPVPEGFARPTWQVLGAPSTNSNEGGFKPPFPAYPSGHATFGAAAFQMVRLFYHQRGDGVLTPLPSSSDMKEGAGTGGGGQEPMKPPKLDPKTANDSIRFEFISDELNGISRNILYQPYNPAQAITDQAGEVRTRLVFKFQSMKEAIFSNAISRIWLGVHWHFDAFNGKDVLVPYTKGGAGEDVSLPRPVNYVQQYQVENDGTTSYLPVDQQDWFQTLGPRDGVANPKVPFGGVPLGINIAQDIFDTGMKFSGSLVDLSSARPDHRP